MLNLEADFGPSVRVWSGAARIRHAASGSIRGCAADTGLGMVPRTSIGLGLGFRV